ncbi:MAG: ABC transporter permease, partial [Pseudomonadota bacterium]
LGQPRFEAFKDVLSQSLKTGLLPILNAMAASGIVALPGMMTGQILAGADPVDATKYQILIMFAIAGSTALGVLLAGLGTLYLLTDDRHRLRLDRLTTPKA